MKLTGKLEEQLLDQARAGHRSQGNYQPLTRTSFRHLWQYPVRREISNEIGDSGRGAFPNNSKPNYISQRVVTHWNKLPESVVTA